MVDHKTHHVSRNTYLAVVKDRKWVVAETFPNAQPLDTAAVCDLVKNPNDNKQYETSL
ncbi:hypothetical protein [Bradyrhizobium neotropicale]|uniref:hypothetical protein n=1 Tax=Bradyrhizobium neotropicale TaxID=1497615 RepID=UPI001FEFE2EC|nr:hypothetical protein [Bradyrhizobium neotropicale]